MNFVYRKSLIATVAYLVISFVAILSLSIFPYEPLRGLEVLGVFSTIELLSFLFINSLIHKKIINFSNIFMLTLYIFNFGQVVIHTYLKGIYSHVRFLLLLDHGEAFTGFKLIFFAFCFLGAGIICSGLKKANFLVKTRDVRKNQEINFEKAAKYVIGLTFPVKILIDAICFYVSMTQGGPAAREWLNNFPNVFTDYGKISLVAFALLIIIYQNQTNKQLMLFVLVEAYILLMMMSGIRSENVGYMLVFLFVYLVSSKKKLRIFSILGYGILGFLALTFIVAVGDFRLVADKSIESFLDVLKRSLTEENIVFRLLDNLGDTGYTAQCVINKWLPQYGPSYGDSYYLGWAPVIPNIPGITDLPGRLAEQSCFPIKLQKAGTLSANYLNIGGSLIGEMFFNFGIYWGIVVAFVLGILIGKLSNKVTGYAQHNNYYGLVKCIPVMFSCIYWIRHYFGGVFRGMVWGFVIFMAAVKLLNLQTKRSILKEGCE